MKKEYRWTVGYTVCFPCQRFTDVDVREGSWTWGNITPKCPRCNRDHTEIVWQDIVGQKYNGVIFIVDEMEEV